MPAPKGEPLVNKDDVGLIVNEIENTRGDICLINRDKGREKYTGLIYIKEPGTGDLQPLFYDVVDTVVSAACLPPVLMYEYGGKYIRLNGAVYLYTRNGVSLYQQNSERTLANNVYSSQTYTRTGTPYDGPLYVRVSDKVFTPALLVNERKANADTFDTIKGRDTVTVVREYGGELVKEEVPAITGRIIVYIDGNGGTKFEYEVKAASIDDLNARLREHGHKIATEGYRSSRNNGELVFYPPHRVFKVIASSGTEGALETNYPDQITST